MLYNSVITKLLYDSDNDIPSICYDNDIAMFYDNDMNPMSEE